MKNAVSTTTPWTVPGAPAEPDDRLVHSRLASPAGSPPVVHLALGAERRRVVARPLQARALPLGEELVVGPHDALPPRLRTARSGSDRNAAPSCGPKTSSSPSGRACCARAAEPRPSAFGPKGKVYDGWETRRRRDREWTRRSSARRAGHGPGVVVDTAFFTGTTRRNRSTRPASPAILASPSCRPRTGSGWCRGRPCAGTPRTCSPLTRAVVDARAAADAPGRGHRAAARARGAAARPRAARPRRPRPGRPGERRPGGGLLEPLLQLPNNLVSPGLARTWRTAGRRPGAATTATTGSSCG